MTTIAPVRIVRVGDDGKPVREERRAIWVHGGLAVTEEFGGRGWVVTHIASGYAALQAFRTQRDAIAAAKLLLPLGNWTLSRTRLTEGMKSGAMAIRTDLRDRRVIS